MKGLGWSGDNMLWMSFMGSDGQWERKEGEGIWLKGFC
jgi:hypothetical protein